MNAGATEGAMVAGPSSPAAVIFDLDGVVTDTAEYHYLGWKRLADEEGLPFDRAANERLRGVSRMESLDLLLGEREASDELKQQWAERKNRYYVEFLERVTPADLLPGALETILACKEHGVAVAIGSSSRNARTVLDRLEVTDLFDAISDGNSVERAKPAPDLFVHAAAQLGIDPARCAVLEDAESGVDAALSAGMVAVGIGPPERVGHATVRFDEVADIDIDAVLRPGGRHDHHLPSNVLVSSPWHVGERALEPSKVMATGSAYGIGNGYLGYRGTFPEWTADQRVACVVAGAYDRADGRWTEPCNAPNGLFARWAIDGEPLAMLPGELHDVTSYERALCVRYGLHRRSWRHRIAEAGAVDVIDERFASYDDLHTIPMRQAVTPDRSVELTLRTGIDGQVWSLHGEHLRAGEASTDGDELVMEATTAEQGLGLVVAQSLRVEGAEPTRVRWWTEQRRILRELAFWLEAGQEVVVETVMAVHHAGEGARPRDAALASARASAARGYQQAKAAHVRHWDRRWDRLDIQVDGDPVAQAALRYNLYQAVIATPAHTDRLPIPARGLASQARQGGATWEQEALSLPMWLYTEPEQARSLLAYRHHTLAAAQRKAASLGYEGAFYASVAGASGAELRPSGAAADMASERSARSRFTDWQVHVSPGVSHAIGEYVRVTQDWGFVDRRGAEMLFEIARFCASRVHVNPARGHYEIVRVVGPDEYHGDVDNSAYTNHAAHTALGLAVDCYEQLARRSPDRLAELVGELALEPAELAVWRDIRDGLALGEPDAETGLIEQFDGYFDLEDATPGQLRERLRHDREHWGWPTGVAVETQVIKQPDVLQLLAAHPGRLTREQLAANYDYYVPRTRAPASSSLSAHALVASLAARPRDAHRWLMANCLLDLTAGEAAEPGGALDGGIRVGACGAAWQIIALGFMGLRGSEDTLALDPALPAHWERLRLPLVWRGQRVAVEAGPAEATVASDPGNTATVAVQVWGQHRRLEVGAAQTVPRP